MGHPLTNNPLASRAHRIVLHGHGIHRPALPPGFPNPQSPPTTLRLATDGKMHVGAGLDRFPGKIGEFPFSSSKDSIDSTKVRREWSRGLGPDTNVKGVREHALSDLTVPDNVPEPAPPEDYAAIAGCVDALRAGGWGAGSSAQFLYCSIIVPHPAYKSNATYMAAVANLTMTVPAQVRPNKKSPCDSLIFATDTLW